MRTYLRGKFTPLFMMLGMLIAIPAVALAAELVTSELDTVTPNAVTVQQGGTTNFNIGMTATGAIASTITSSNASTATVDTVYSLNNTGAVSGITPSSAFKFYSSGTNCNAGGNCDVTWDGAPTAYSVGASVSAASTTPVGDYSLVLSDSANTTDLTNPSVSGGKLGDTAATTITVHVVAPPPPACTNPADPTFSGTPDGSNDWYKTTPTVSASSSTSGAVVKYSNAADGTYSTTAPTLGEGTTTVYAKAFSSTGSCSSAAVSKTYKVDTIAPSINDDGTTQTANAAGWFKAAVSNNFSASDATSGLADASKANFSVSSGTNEGSAVKINSGPVSDNAGNTNLGIDSAAFKIDMTNPLANCDSAPTSWSATDVSIRCQPTDALSGLANTADGDFNLSTTVAANTETSNASTNSRTVADAAGNSVTAGPITGLKVDKKAPVLTDEGPTTTPNGDNGWYKSAVTNGFKATDGGSGFAPSGNLTNSFTKSSGTNEGAAVKIASGAVSDAVGNSAASIDSAEFQIDLSDPTNVRFSGGPDADGSYFFGETPDKPTCAADDLVSGFASCEVTGYSTAVSAPGTHTMTATAKDNAGRTATATRSYTVKAWTTKGFYAPVDMTPANTPPVYNTVKGGSTVPLKFELFSGTNELTATSAIQSLTATKSTCAPGATEDAIEVTATGATSLRYDSTGGQFIYNWKTPTGAGCYTVTMLAQDGSKITAYFKSLK